MMNHVAQVLHLRPGCYDKYKQYHDELWPELRDLMQKHGVSMVIYRYGEHLFVHGIAPSAQAWQDIGDDPISDRWNKFMAEVLETEADNDNQLKRDIPELAFLFGDFAS